jgi:hypothetical protein
MRRIQIRNETAAIARNWNERRWQITAQGLSCSMRGTCHIDPKGRAFIGLCKNTLDLRACAAPGSELHQKRPIGPWEVDIQRLFRRFDLAR